VRIHLPELISHTDIEPSYVEMLSRAATSALDVGEVLRAVDQSFADPRQLTENRRQVAAEMFYQPGTATSRAVAEMYDLLELDGQGDENEHHGTGRSLNN